MKAKEFYTVAVYLRLSREDSITGNSDINFSGKPESNSISSQRDMICDYVKKHDNMEIYEIYADDGYSGTNFDRPEFKRMLADIEAGKADCVIVKDLSRLGRDYIGVGRLLQKSFPALGVRFIALTDGYDSLTADFNEASLVVPVKNFVNDAYSRDISVKVRSHQKLKREKGDFIGAFAAYGYEKSKDNRNLLVPDYYAANIVKRIFAWKTAGCSNLAIAQMLDGMGILSPLEYKKIKGEHFQTGFVSGTKAKWSSVAVKRILTNENYTGTLVQGKEEKINYKVKKTIKKPKEEWTRVPGAHEAIISKEDFELVQDLLRTDVRTDSQKKTHMYAGLLFCGDCGENMIRRINRNKSGEKLSFICPTGNKGGKCARHTISENDLKYIVATGIKRYIELLGNIAHIEEGIENNKTDLLEKTAFNNEIKRLRGEQEKYSELSVGLYEDLKKQVITMEDFKTFKKIYEKRYDELGKAVARQEKALKKLFRQKTAIQIKQELSEIMQATEPDRRILVSFIKRIYVYENKRICIEFRIRGLD